MEIRLTYHAEQQARFLELTRAEVEDIITTPDSVRTDETVTIARKGLKGTVYEAVSAERFGYTLVITVYEVHRERR